MAPKIYLFTFEKDKEQELLHKQSKQKIEDISFISQVIKSIYKVFKWSR